MAKAKVLTLIDTLSAAGAERVAVNLAVATQQSSEFLPLVCATRRGGELEPLLKQAGVEYRVLGRSSSWDIAPMLRLARWIREQNVALIHAHMKGSNFWAGVLGLLVGTPVVAHAHGQPTGPGDLVVNVVISALAGRIIAVSERERRNLIRAPLISGRNVVAIQNGLDSAVYALERDPSLRLELGIPADALVVGICAQLRAEKNHEVFLQAAKQLSDRNSGVFFLIIGDGERRADLERLAGELGLRDRCIFSGHRNDVPKLLKTLDIGVLTSKREGLPLGILEYMTSGLPVVATNVGGISEAIRDAENGYLVASGDVSGVAEALQKLLDSADLRARFARRGQEIFDQAFSQQVMLSKVFDQYRELLKGSAQARRQT